MGDYHRTHATQCCRIPSHRVVLRWILVDRGLRGVCRTWFCCCNHDDELWSISGICLTFQINVEQIKTSHTSKFFWSLILVVSVKANLTGTFIILPEGWSSTDMQFPTPQSVLDSLHSVALPFQHLAARRHTASRILMLADSIFVSPFGSPIPSSRRVPSYSKTSQRLRQVFWLDSSLK